MGLVPARATTTRAFTPVFDGLWWSPLRFRGQPMLKPVRVFCSALAATLLLATAPASAQFYKNKILTLMVNYGVGGNADTEARLYQHYLPKYIPGNPTVIIRNVPGAGGATAMNQLGLNIGSQPDGLTAGYFTASATQSLVDDPSLRVKLYDFAVIVAARGWNIVYARKDIAPGGLTRPSASRPSDRISSSPGALTRRLVEWWPIWGTLRSL